MRCMATTQWASWRFSKLREDYKRKMGPEYSLQKFHDAFIALGPLPLPLIRRAMLGESGELF